jgi:N-acetylglutamate synthase-like GNAT family acetyltransferase
MQSQKKLFALGRSTGFFKVKNFQTALKKTQKLDRFKDNKNNFAARNDLAFAVSKVQFGNL